MVHVSGSRSVSVLVLIASSVLSLPIYALAALGHAQEPPLPPDATSVLRFDRHDDRTVICAQTGEPDIEHGSRALPATEIWLLEAGAFRQIDASPGACDPALSLDGRSVAFTAPDGLWVLGDLSSGVPERLLESPTPTEETEFGYVAFMRPKWSPNGARLGYVASNGGTAWVEVVEVVDGRLRYRSSADTYAFAWGADSRSLKIGGNTVLLP